MLYAYKNVMQEPLYILVFIMHAQDDGDVSTPSSCSNTPTPAKLLRAPTVRYRRKVA